MTTDSLKIGKHGSVATGLTIHQTKPQSQYNKKTQITSKDLVGGRFEKCRIGNYDSPEQDNPTSKRMNSKDRDEG